MRLSFYYVRQIGQNFFFFSAFFKILFLLSLHFNSIRAFSTTEQIAPNTTHPNPNISTPKNFIVEFFESIKHFFMEDDEHLNEDDEQDILMPQIPKKLGDAKTVVETRIKSREKPLTSLYLNKFNAVYLKELYRAVLQREITREEFDKWMNTLEQGASREGIYRALVLNKEYADKMESEYASHLTLSSNLVQFSIHYLNEFLNRTIDEKKISKMGPSYLKQYMVEKTLEVIDVLIEKEEDYYNWYALFSKKLAKDYAPFFAKNTQKIISASVHKAWVKEVSFTESKGEVIIKLHSLVNKLQ